jgi:subfamily B ATP-binding cassette protein MsbA
MHNDKDLYVADVSPTMANHSAFKSGLIVAGIALVLNAASDTFMLSLLKPLLDDGFGKTDRSCAVDAAGGHWADDSSWLNQLCLQLLYLMGVGKVVMTMRRRLFGHMMGMPVSFLINSLQVRCCHVLPMIQSRSRHRLPAR